MSGFKLANAVFNSPIACFGLFLIVLSKDSSLIPYLSHSFYNSSHLSLILYCGIFLSTASLITSFVSPPIILETFAFIRLGSNKNILCRNAYKSS
nr:MAG TPA: hypothetical protein [Caudoviricetes sp.]